MPSPTMSDVAGPAEPHRPAAAGAEHHLLRIHRRLASAVAREKSTMDRQRRIVRAARHESNGCRPDAAGWVFQSGMEAERRRRRNMQSARGEIGFDYCSVRPPSRNAKWRVRPRFSLRRFYTALDRCRLWDGKMRKYSQPKVQASAALR